MLLLNIYSLRSSSSNFVNDFTELPTCSITMHRTYACAWQPIIIATKTSLGTGYIFCFTAAYYDMKLQGAIGFGAVTGIIKLSADTSQSYLAMSTNEGTGQLPSTASPAETLKEHAG